MKLLMPILILCFTNCGYNNAYKDIHDLQNAQNQSEAEVTAMNVQIEAMQTSIVQMQATLAQLAGYTHVVSIENPCGDFPGKVDEVLLRLSTGELLASFSDNANGLNTRFAIVGPGTYNTTDGTGCTFTVLPGGMIQ